MGQSLIVFFSKAAHRISMKRVKKGKRGKRGLKGKKVTAGIFQKESHFGKKFQKYPQNRVFWSFQILGFT